MLPNWNNSRNLITKSKIAEDKKNIKELVGIIKINKDFTDKTGRVLRVRNFVKGLTYGRLDCVSDIHLAGLGVVAVIDGKDYKDLPSMEAGGPTRFTTEPIGNKKAYFKIKVLKTGEEFNINIQ